MKHWIALIVLVLATAAYVYQSQFAAKKKPLPAPEAPAVLADAINLSKIHAFVAAARLRSTILGPPDIAIIDGREIAEGGQLSAAPGLDLEVRDVGDGFVLLGYGDKSFRLEKVAPPPPTPRR